MPFWSQSGGQSDGVPNKEAGERIHAQKQIAGKINSNMSLVLWTFSGDVGQPWQSFLPIWPPSQLQFGLEVSEPCVKVLEVRCLAAAAWPNSTFFSNKLWFYCQGRQRDRSKHIHIPAKSRVEEKKVVFPSASVYQDREATVTLKGSGSQINSNYPVPEFRNIFWGKQHLIVEMLKGFQISEGAFAFSWTIPMLF